MRQPAGSARVCKAGATETNGFVLNKSTEEREHLPEEEYSTDDSFKAGRINEVDG